MFIYPFLHHFTGGREDANGSIVVHVCPVRRFKDGVDYGCFQEDGMRQFCVDRLIKWVMGSARETEFFEIQYQYHEHPWPLNYLVSQ